MNEGLGLSLLPDFVLTIVSIFTHFYPFRQVEYFSGAITYKKLQKNINKYKIIYMINDKILKENLKDFENTDKYSSKQLADFLSENPVTNGFYKLHVDKIKQYLKQKRNLIENFAEDYFHFCPPGKNCYHENKYEYSKEERKFIKEEIIEKHLITFWILDLEKDGLDIIDCEELEQKFAVKTYLDKQPIIDLIDYIIKFCPECSSVDTSSPVLEKGNFDFNCNPVFKTLDNDYKKICKYILRGFSKKEVAKKTGFAISTVSNKIGEICKIFHDSGIKKSKKGGYEELRIFLFNQLAIQQKSKK